MLFNAPHNKESIETFKYVKKEGIAVLEPKAIRYENLTLDMAKHYADTRGIILVPAATTEGHGFHTPLGTDTFIAEYLTGKLSEITGLPALLPTPIRCGCSPTFHFDLEGNPMFGTLAISHSTMQILVKDLCRALWSSGFRKVIFVQTHGQEWNFQTIVHEVATELRREGKFLYIAGATYWELCRKELEKEISAPFWHACEWETSAMKFICPELVKEEAIEGFVRVPHIDKTLMKRSVCMDESETFAVQDIASWVNIPEVGEIHNWGVGPTEAIKSATAEKGQKVLEVALDKYLALIRDLEKYYAPNEVPGVDVRQRAAEPRFKVDY
jgi:creatinine amidohydrolase/Fe(II)-dependent formamide hydrolase-like protein